MKKGKSCLLRITIYRKKSDEIAHRKKTFTVLVRLGFLDIQFCKEVSSRYGDIKNSFHVIESHAEYYTVEKKIDRFRDFENGRSTCS